MRLAVRFVCIMLPPMPLFRIVPAVALTLCLAIAPAQAQFWGNNGWGNSWGGWGSPYRQAPRPSAPSTPKPPAQASAPPGPAVEDMPAPYDRDLQRLSEILGALHFLRNICGFDEGQKWRDEAQSLINAEAPSGKRHDQMVQSFNRGYLGFRQSYRTCTPAARILIRRYLEEGAQIARDVTARYAN
jgi:uncharacterized protein (TIGR02301 family)